MLTIDVGNSRIKWAVINQGVINEHGEAEYSERSFESVLGSMGMPVLKNVCISFVAQPELKLKLEHWLNARGCEVTFFAKTMARQHGVINSYNRPENMGVDRWMAMIAAYQLCGIASNDAVCVIDCGTAITLDVVGADGRHAGGLILPGFRAMVSTLVSNTGNINASDSLVYSEDLNVGLATSTHDSVAKGCARLINEGVSGILKSCEKNIAGKLHCVVTGGDGEWVAKALAYENTYNPYLVLQGLNFISADMNS
jgi:type III pantothenate kinase